MKAIEADKLIKQEGYLLVDIRDASEQIQGVAKSAQCMTADQLKAAAVQLKASHKKIIVMCYKGVRSQQLCDQLGRQFVSLSGGFESWCLNNLSIEIPTFNENQIRYQQQIKLAGFGQSAQVKLAQSHVMVVGAGGLGSPALLYLAAAGVGEITLIDDDVVSLSNLHRQILYRENDIGMKKSTQAANELKRLNSSIVINAICDRLSESNVTDLTKGVDMIIDGSDNIQTRYLINDHCNQMAVPWVFAAVTGFEIQVAVFGHEAGEQCYRCLFPHISENDAGNCSAEGILGSVPGMAAMVQVTEAIKYLTGIGENLRNKMMAYNVLNHQFKVLKYPPQQQCQHR